MSFTSLRGTPFNLPCRRRLWQVLGEYDALVEYIELTTRRFNTQYESQHVLSLSDFLSSEAKKENICLNNLTLANYECFKFKFYLILPYSAFDRFLDDFRKEYYLLFDKHIPLDHNKTKLKSILDYLISDSFAVPLESFSQLLFDYYRLVRNSLAHDSISKISEITDLFRSLSIYDIQSRYPKLSAPNNIYNMTFDDFILCTANIKSIAEKLTLSLEDKIDWVKFSERHSEKFAKLRQFKSNKPRQVVYVKNVISGIYGTRLSDACVEKILRVLPIE